MTIRGGTLGFIVAAALTVGAMGMFAALWPSWQREVKQLAAERDKLVSEAERLANLADNLQEAMRSTAAGKAQLAALLTKLSAEARETQETLQGSLADLERQVRLGQDDLVAYKRALTDQQAVAQQNASAAEQQMAALQDALRQSGQREGALQVQVADAQGQAQGLAAAAAKERDRLWCDLRAAQMEIARQREALVAQQAATDGAARQVTELQEELRRSRLREQVLADHLQARQQRLDEWERRGRHEDGLRSDRERLERDLAALQQENKKLQAENADLRHRLEQQRGEISDGGNLRQENRRLQGEVTNLQNAVNRLQAENAARKR